MVAQKIKVLTRPHRFGKSALTATITQVVGTRWKRANLQVPVQEFQQDAREALSACAVHILTNVARMLSDIRLTCGQGGVDQADVLRAMGMVLPRDLKRPSMADRAQEAVEGTRRSSIHRGVWVVAIRILSHAGVHPDRVARLRFAALAAFLLREISILASHTQFTHRRRRSNNKWTTNVKARHLLTGLSRDLEFRLVLGLHVRG